MANGSGDKSFEPEVKICDNSSFLPKSDYVSEGLERFPLLVWKRILENCWSWDYLDMLNFVEAVKLPVDFLSNQELASVRKNVFFHVLLPILTSNYVGEGYMSDHSSLLDFQDIGNCRMVCRGWNSAIRKNVVEHTSRSHPNCCLHEWDSNFLWPKESDNPYANNCNRPYSVFSFTSRLNKFLSHFSQSHKCQGKGNVSPFHCHHVGVQLSSHSDSQFMGDIEVTVASAEKFFVEYGKHLRLLNLNLCYLEANSVGCLYPGFFDLLRKSQNLEALRISWTCTLLDGIEASWKSNVSSKGVSKGSCPDLKLLTHLEVDCLPHPLFNDIIKSNGSHIEKLKISNLEVSRYALFRKYELHRLNNLRELRISFECATTNDIVRLAKSAPHWTKLKKLHLDFEGGGRSPKSISWFLILQCLNKFSKSVTHLWLRFPTLTSELYVSLHDYRPTREERLKLSNLEEIVLKFPQASAFSFDFLDGLEKLQTLYFHDLGVPLKMDEICKNKFVLIRKYQNSLGPDKIKFSPHDLHDSKIWEQFPRLSNLYGRQPEKKFAWKKVMKKLKRKSRAEPTAWTLQDMVEEIPEYWTKYLAQMKYIVRLTQNAR